MKKFDVYEMVTKLIIERLESGVIPWRMPWKNGSGMPQNLVSKKNYRGFNFIYLLSFGYEQPYFLSFKQAQDLGGHVKKGAKSIEVIFWKMRDHVNATGKEEKIPMLRYYRVFHISDVEGIDLTRLPQLQSHDHDFTPIEACENIMEAWTDKPVIETGKHHACYIPSRDVIQMPDPRTFFEDSEYFSVLFHEACHCTGHSKRLNRDMSGHYGDDFYAAEELIAEMGAAYLCALCGIQTKTIDNSAAYIKGWLSKFKSDNKFLVMAASKAQHAVDYITGTQFESVESEAEESEKETETAQSEKVIETVHFF
jgi:antirestriction protein ArdC